VFFVIFRYNKNKFKEDKMLKYDIGKDIKKANELVYLKSKFNEIELKLFNIILNQEQEKYHHIVLWLQCFYLPIPHYSK